jgi:hypothetical protein
MAWLCDLCDAHSTKTVRWPMTDGARVAALCPDHMDQLYVLGIIMSVFGAMSEKGPDRWKA